MLEYGDGHRPGFLTPYFFGINATFAITQLRGLSTTYYIGEKEEHLIHKDAYPGYGDFVTACTNEDAERKAYYQKNKASHAVATANVTLAPERYHTNFSVNGVVIGIAETTISQTAFDTNYYRGSVLVGSSHTVRKGGFYETTYTDAKGNFVGASRMLSEAVEFTTTYDFPSINEKIKTENHSAENQTIPYNTNSPQEENTRYASEPEPFRMFGGHIERKPQQSNEKKRHRCSIL